uniref:Uncharacterized protein n=1 Tax=Manihot esculenta TaxID=3983 RepID=A0A2C9VVK3_MANES
MIEVIIFVGAITPSDIDHSFINNGIHYSRPEPSIIRRSAPLFDSIIFQGPRSLRHILDDSCSNLNVFSLIF